MQNSLTIKREGPMSAESLVLFGGILLAFSLLRNRRRSSKRMPGSMRLVVLLAEGTVLIVGLISLLVGLREYL
ncbi:MAG: hypothetical protein UY34_C0001G0150 [Parcubacteria group bacterium GW2011_GWA2_48_9]|nr:MAG: hypothetical protein UY34_C0001G0150 [Parcubacteria group bacterium GW2011_GWA2_48_9]